MSWAYTCQVRLFLFGVMNVHLSGTAVAVWCHVRTLFRYGCFSLVLWTYTCQVRLFLFGVMSVHLSGTYGVSALCLFTFGVVIIRDALWNPQSRFWLAPYLDTEGVSLLAFSLLVTLSIVMPLWNPQSRFWLAPYLGTATTAGRGRRL